ncbi:MAG: CRISPR-associated protein Cas5 [Candidatus Bathyarchaeia archaeon]|jgi:CRISPR-associated protein Cas5 subtype I-B|nr:CRISPR-associated protein Cas5 [Candidatus Bathyarchaeota archaeon A05DMB-3]
MQAILAEITFYEAFFKVHYTKGFRLTYPMPLPTSVAGIFGAMLGIERKEIKDEFKEMLFGSGILSYEGFTIENETFLQYKTARVQKGVVRTQIVNHPTYLIAIAGQSERITKYFNSLKDNNFVYLPYGGQNDFFIEDLTINGVANVIQSEVVSNYAPQDMVIGLESSETTLNILPVMHTYSPNPNFYFVLKGVLKLKERVNVIENSNIAVYPLEMFKIVYG